MDRPHLSVRKSQSQLTMSKDITVLAPNGRRQTVKCTLNTTILQILEDVCTKQGFEAGDYDLKHHNKVLDLTNTVRFTNLPNKACLEMVEAERKREDNIVTIGLQLENGERRLGEFPPHSSLYLILESLAKEETSSCVHPTIIYMRREVFGDAALRGTTLRQLGLTGGRAVLRLMNKSPEELKNQANVSCVLPLRPSQASEHTASTSSNTGTPGANHLSYPEPAPGTSDTMKPTAHGINPIQFLKEEKIKKSVEFGKVEKSEYTVGRIDSEDSAMVCDNDEPTTSYLTCGATEPTKMQLDEDLLQRRLNIEQEVTFLGDSNKAIVFVQPDSAEHELEDLPDEFYDLTIEEVRRLYKELQTQRSSMENAPLVTSQHRSMEVDSQSSHHNSHNNVVVRIQFPDRMVLQGIFEPTDTIERVRDFTKLYLREPQRPFHLFTTPSREVLDPTVTLLEAQFVPCVLMHFRWADDDTSARVCLKEDVYCRKTSSDAAAMLASKYRTPTRRKLEVTAGPSQQPAVGGPTAAKDSKLPKWLKLKH